MNTICEACPFFYVGFQGLCAEAPLGSYERRGGASFARFCSAVLCICGPNTHRPTLRLSLPSVHPSATALPSEIGCI